MNSEINAPTPVIQGIQQYNNIKTFEVKCENELYTLKIGENPNKIFFSISKKDNTLLIFEKESSFEELLKLSENLNIFKSTNILYNSFDKLVKNNKIIIEKDEKDLSILKLGIITYNIFGEEIKCFICLKLKEPKDENSIKKLIIEVSELKKELSKKNEEISKLNEKLEKLEKKVESFEILEKKIESIEKLELIENERKRTEKINEILIKYPGFAQSDIIKEPKEVELLLNKFMKEFNNTSFELLYKLVKEEDEIIPLNNCIRTFYKNNAQIEHILIIIQTTDNIKFGGFTSLTFGKYNSFNGIKDDKAFLFSLTKNKIYDISKGKDAIYDNINIHFAHGFCLRNNFNQRQEISPWLKYDDENPSFPDNSHFDINNGQKCFYIQNFEAYHVKN